MNEKQLKIVSFIGGLVFFSIVVGVVLVKNERIRAEVEEQTMNILKTTKGAIGQIQYLVSKVEKMTGENKSTKQGSSATESSIAVNEETYDALWDSLKA